MPPARTASTRARPTALLALAAGLLVARVAIGVYDAGHPPAPGGLVRWMSAGEAQQRSGSEGKPILYDFSASWCEPCKKMEREVFADAAAAAYINDTYLPVRITDDDPSAVATVARTRYEVTGLPTLLVVSRKAKQPRRAEGYPGKRRVLAFLRGEPGT